jgi:hypothetical protein
MKIFVLGCSWSWHEDISPEDTWPAQLAQQLPDCMVINGAIPGSSVDSYYYRITQMAEEFGKPDHVIIQLTGLLRTFLLKNYVKVSDFHSMNSNYVYCMPINMYEHYTYVTPSRLDLSNHDTFRGFFNHPGISESTVKKYFINYFDPDFELHRYNVYKEIELLKLYSSGNITMFNWLHEKGYDAYFNKHPEFYIGSPVEELSKDMIDEYSIDEHFHFSKYGHEYVTNWIMNKKWINNG